MYEVSHVQVSSRDRSHMDRVECRGEGARGGVGEKKR